MPIDINAGSNIPLSMAPAPPAIDPIEELSKIQGMRNANALAAQRAAASSQALQTGDLELQQKQQDLKDQQIIADAQRSSSAPAPGAAAGAPIAPPDPNAVLMRMMQDQRGASGKAIQSYMQQMLKNRETQATAARDDAQAASDNATAQAKRADAVMGASQSLLDLGDVDDPQAESARAAQWPQARQTLIDRGHLTPDQVPALYPGGAWLQQQHNLNQTGSANIAAKQEAAKQKIADAEEARKAAEAPAALTKLQNDALASTLNDKGLTQEQAQQASDRAATLQQQADNAAAEQKSKQANLALEQQRNQREQKVYENTYGEGANQALTAVDPKLRIPATAASQKAADEYNKAGAAEADMRTFLDQAKAGNKEAYAYLSPEGVLTLNTARGVTRVNRQEIDAYAGAGSMVDNIVAKVGKLAKGQSIPPDILSDIDKLHSAIASNSDQTYNTKLAAVNQNYGAHFQPVPKRQAGPSAPETMKVRRKSDGTTGTINASDFDDSKYEKQ